MGRKVRSQTVKAGTGEVLADYVWEYNPAGEIVKEAPWHLGAVFADGRDARGRLTFQATPGNHGGSTPPPFENTIVGMPEGNQADPSLEAQGTPKKVLPVPARIAGYTLDPLGNRMFMQVDGVGTTLTYDAASRLISEISTNGKSVTHEYDDWGQEIRKTTIQDGFATATEAYGYDYLGRMSAYANSATGATWQYDYWPNGDRYSKTNLSTQWKELYVPILGQVVADYTQTGSDEIQHQASYAQGEGSKAARISSGGTRTHYVLGLGGSFDLTLGDEGAVLAEAVRDSFGVSMGGDSVGPYGYAQMRNDSESGLWTSANGGLYDASTGRIFDSAEGYGDWVDAQSVAASGQRIAVLERELESLKGDTFNRFVWNISGDLFRETGYATIQMEMAREKGTLGNAQGLYRETMSGWSGLLIQGAAEISLVNSVSRIRLGRSITDPTEIASIDRWNEGVLVAATFGLMAWSNALRAELSATRAISLEVEGAAQLARHERALAIHARAHAAARAEMSASSAAVPAAFGMHPGAASAGSSAVSRPSILRQLRAAGTPEALATAALIKRGNVELRIIPTGTGHKESGLYFGAPTRSVFVCSDKSPTGYYGAATAAHETRHFLDRVTPATYNKIHEVRAYRWERAAGFNNMTDREIIEHVKKYYPHVPGELP